jgi:hypothetical protein
MRRIRFNDEIYLKYIISNNIDYRASADLYGCFILKELAILPSGDEHFILERFDGHKIMISEDKISTKERICKKDPALRAFEIVNIYYDVLFHYHIKKSYNRTSYCPTYNSIISYIREEWEIFKYNVIERDNIEVKAVNLTKQQMENLISKLNLVGATYKLVGYNTYAVVSNNRIDVYTRQKEVII